MKCIYFWDIRDSHKGVVEHSGLLGYVGGGEPLTQPNGVTSLNTFTVLMYKSGSRQRLNSLNHVTDGSCKLLQIT